MKKERDIPFKNYVILALVLILTIVVVIYFFKWYSFRERSVLGISIMDDYLMSINYNELDDYLIENKNAYIYVSVLNDSNIRRFENRFKNIIVRDNLGSYLLYMDLTGDVNKLDKYGSSINIPCILVFNDGVLLDVYDIKRDNFNVNKLEEYLEKEVVIYD